MLYVRRSCCDNNVTDVGQGIGDLINFYEPIATEDDAPPPKPNTMVITICLDAMVYGAYIALHYFRKNASKGGKLFFTSSMCGLYPGQDIPQYTAAKHGIVGLTRALASRLKENGEPITVNCVCPGMVNLPPTHKHRQLTRRRSGSHWPDPDAHGQQAPGR